MLKPLKFRQNQAGQTLVEVVIAIAVLALAMGSAGSLAATSTRVTTESGRRTQATALAAREAEALRNLRDALSVRTTDPRTLRQYFESNPGRSTAGGAPGCRSFVMAETIAGFGGWITVPTASYGQPVDFNANGFGPHMSIEGMENYSRVITVCPGEDYDSVDDNFSPSEHLYDVSVRVTWTESGGPERELTYRTMLATPRGAHYE